MPLTKLAGSHAGDGLTTGARWSAKTWLPAIALVIGALGAMTLSSCDVLSMLFGSPYASRISSFENHLNDDQYDVIYKDFSSASTQDYDSIKDPSFWDSSPLAQADAPFTFSDESDSGNTATITVQNNVDEGFTMTLQMTQDGSTWYIHTLDLEPTSGSSAGTFQVKHVR